MDGFNQYRSARVAELLIQFREFQFAIAVVPAEPPLSDDFYTEGWAALRQCAHDGVHILNCAADTRVPEARGGQQEQDKAELQQVYLDAYSRRHEGKKITVRQEAARRWIERRDAILQGQRPTVSHTAHLAAVDHQLRSELALITDEFIHAEMQAWDQSRGSWTAEDPSLANVQRWVRTRTPA